MKPNLTPAGLLLLICFSASAATRYVNLNNSNPAAPYTSWASAATTIQDAVDAAVSGETILVTNGVYATGGRAVHGTMTNRVAVDKPVHLLSVNGPQFTVIQGYQVPGTTNGEGAIRCVYLTNGASLSGFTLTNGATRATNDYVRFQESSGGGVHCEALQSFLDPPTVVSNCIITGSSAFGPGGGVYGGGVSSAQIIDCELRGNTAQFGGGVAEGWVIRCLIADNAAENGGGASEAYGEAGGFEYYSCKLDNCLLVGNRAQFNGGGAYACELNNCTVVGNSAGEAGGGLYGFFVIQVQAPSRAVNSIVYSNTAPSDANFVDGSCNLENSCTTPLPGWGSANITNAPSFVDFVGGNCRLQADSPCINSGTNYYAPGPFDLDGNPRIRGGTVDMGVFEFQQGSTGLVHYVNLLNPNPVSPYLSWATAATNIQDAIDVASPGAEVIVTNGVYATGGRAIHGAMTNRVAVDKPLTLRSVNGPQFTVIQGYQVPGTTNGDGAIRCVYLTNGASLSGFTLTNGATQPISQEERLACGGGVWCEGTNAVVTNCIISGNRAGWRGGGARSGILLDCELRNNSSAVGGGAAQAILVNCTVSSNSAPNGGGTWASFLTNSLIIGNLSYYGGGSSEDVLVNCRLIGNSAPGWGGGGAAGSKLIGCTLTGNSSIGGPYGYGGGAIASVLNDCYLSNNIAQVGGGASGSPSQSYPCILTNCVLIDNSAVAGAGAALSILINCTLVRNSAQDRAGGAYRCSTTNGFVRNSVIYFNAAPIDPNCSESTLDYSCTTPDPGGAGNITGNPLFLDHSGGNFRLQANSPCINTGDTIFAYGPTDLDARPRVVGNAVDMGAYEFQAVQPVLRIAQSGTNILLAWPLWASNFDLQQTTVVPPNATDWGNSLILPTVANGENTITLPLDAGPKLFRLFKP